MAMYDWNPVAPIIAKELPPGMIGSQRFTELGVQYRVVDTDGPVHVVVYEGSSADGLYRAVQRRLAACQG